MTNTTGPTFNELIAFGEVEKVRALLNDGAVPVIGGGVRQSSLHVAVRTPNRAPEMVRLLLAHASPPNDTDEEGTLVLYSAANSLHVSEEIVEILLSTKKIIRSVHNRVTNYPGSGETPLHGVTSVVKAELLLNYNFNLHLKDTTHHHLTPLESVLARAYWYSKAGHHSLTENLLSVARLFIKRGAPTDHLRLPGLKPMPLTELIFSLGLLEWLT